jgi:hypothetical protein
MNASNRGERRSINAIQGLVDALKEIAHAMQCLGIRHGTGAFVEFPQVGTGTEPGSHLTVNNYRMRMLFESVQGSNKLLQFFEGD